MSSPPGTEADFELDTTFPSWVRTADMFSDQNRVEKIDSEIFLESEAKAHNISKPSLPF